MSNDISRKYINVGYIEREPERGSIECSGRRMDCQHGNHGQSVTALHPKHFEERTVRTVSL